MRKNEINSFKKMLWMSMMVPMLLSISLFGAEPMRIMPLGDSITHEDYRDSADEKADADRSAYRDDLWYSLHGAGYDIDFVGSQKSGQDIEPPFDFDHEGHDGLEKSEMAANVKGYLERAKAEGNPVDIVLLHIGTNGIRSDVTPDDINLTLANIQEYEDSNNPVKVILARIINCRKDWTSPPEVSDNICTDEVSENFTTLNTNVFNMAQERISNGDDIVIVDMENGAGLDYDGTDGSSDMIDDLHPNDAGYAKMAKVWYTALESTLTTNQEHHWNFDEDNTVTTYVDSHSVSDATCASPGCPAAVDGIIHGAQEFDGNDDRMDITVTSNFDWDANDDFTIEFWMKPNTAATDEPDVIIGRFNSGNNNWWIGRSGNKVKVEIDGAMISDTTIDTSGNQWTHVVAVRDATNSQLRLYINGTLDPAFPVSINPKDYSGDADVVVGFFDAGYGTDYYFKGGLDEVAIYNNAMDPDQIKRRFQNGTGGFVITSTPVTSAALNSDYLYNVNTSDDSAAFGNYTLSVNSDPMPIGDDGLIEWRADVVGNIPFAIVANNGKIDALQNFDVKVRDTNNMPNSMTHYWKLNEDTLSTTYLDAYNGVTDATCSVGCPEQTSGQVDEAQNFSIRNSDLNVPDDDSFDWATGDSFTIEFWMKSNTDATDKPDVAIGRYNKNPDNSLKSAWWIARSGNKVKVEIDGAMISDTTIDTSGNQWTHVVAVRDATNSQLRLYINGTLDPAFPVSINPKDYSGDAAINIGWFNDGLGTDYYFSGALDEIAIFNSVLPANEIDAHYKNGFAGNGFDNPDETAPVITLIEPNPQLTPVGDTYTELGATAYDNVDGDIPAANIVIDSSAVDINTVGSYSVTYDVKDAAGNDAKTKTRTVKVVDTTAPVITLTGAETINLLLGETYTEQGATCSDNYDTTCTVTIGGDTVDTSIVGIYIVTYDATDTSGNTAQVPRTVNVTTGNAPVIKLKGDNPYTVEVYSTYTDPGATATDIEDGSVPVTDNSATAVNTANLGDQTVTYEATDSNGNTVQATRTVKVVDVLIQPLLLSDFTANGSNDLLWHKASTGAVRIMEMNGMLPDANISVVESANTNLLPKGIGDFTGDGKPDILFHNQNSGNLRIWEMDGTVKGENIQVLGSSNTNLQIAGVGDFDLDGDTDIATFNTNSGALRMWVMEGTTRVDNILVLTGANTNLVPRGAGDMDNDGIPDIVLRNNNSGAVRVWTMNSDFTRKGNEYVTGSSNTNLELRGVVDINGDGNNDILNYNTNTGKLRAWLMDGSLSITENAVIVQDLDLDWSVRN